MDTRAKARRAWRWLIGPEPWTAQRIIGEAAVLLLLLLSCVGLQFLSGSRGPAIVAVALGALLLALLRRPLPGTVLLVSASAAAVVTGLALLLPVVGWSVGQRIHRVGRALAVFTAAFVLSSAVAAINVLREGAGPNSWVGVFFYTLWFLAVVAVPGLIARYLAQRRALVASLQAQHHHLLRENAVIARETRLRERQRIAQDMHDSLGHQLTLIAVHTGALQVDPQLSGPQREAVGVLREASVSAMRELREVVGLLRDEPDDQEAPSAAARGVADIKELVEASRSAGTPVVLREFGEPRSLTPAADRAAYRIAQEGLTNAHKHASGAPITMALRYEPDSLLVEVVNGPAPESSGPAAPGVSGGQGLAGLHERARLVGGMLHSGPTGDGGFRLTGVLPYTATNVDSAEDFRRQPGVTALGDGGPDNDWSRSHEEFDKAMNSRTRGCLVWGAGIALVLVGLIVVGAVWFFTAIDESMITKDTYDSVEVGQREDEVRAKLPKGSRFNEGLDDDGPPRPAGASCLVLTAEDPLLEKDSGWLARFCFRDGKLIEKRAFD
ncbi:sensor histidine kinase [Streptomyces gobiensis]|uniref:sensor histidine kinase n=1 Tax=Streptomyces gobiensis TaxID=2875706 RepID=UPI001E5E6D08|nr:histidine kinase [Streptomyces gobiensis]UGY92142.1 histidine kinase [Streptomyces gobiensis]